MLKDDLEVMRPVRLAEVQEAQQAIVTVALQLKNDGKLVIAGAGGDDSSSAGKVLGCGALAVCGEAGEKFGELKSMYTDSAARGCGVGGALLARLEEEAQLERLQCLRLETGNKLHAALSFYHGAGFVERGPFGMYEANGTSLFMEKALPHETR